jgi:adenosylmethionine-8-amino-7-oxononanoate aminotransferase
MLSVNEIEKLDRDHIWHPCSQMKDYEKYPAIYIEKGEGVWLYKKDGARILDAISSWWVNLFGHAHPYIAAQVIDQVQKLEQVIFANYTHAPAAELARHLVGLFDGALDKVFYADNGSSAIEVALKMSYHYWLNAGVPGKNKFAHIKGAYHGETIGALSVGSLGTYKKTYQPLLLETVEMDGPDCFRCRYGRTRKECQAECFAETQTVLEQRQHELSAFIIEPLCQAAAGMAIYPPVYLRKAHAKCRELNIHLICDEIAVGFGRTGTMMASHQADIVPDFVAVSKGLTGGFLPLSAVLTCKDIYDQFYGDYSEQRAFMHSHSYSGNPLACRAACAVFELFQGSDVLAANNIKSETIYHELTPLLEHKNVGEIRRCGMIVAIELVKDKASGEAFDWRERIGHRIYRFAEQQGLLLRPLGDVIYLMPPYVINDEEIRFMTQTTMRSIREILP